MSLLIRFRAEVPLRISPHAEGPLDAGIHGHSAERSVVRPSRALFARVPMRLPWRQGSAQTLLPHQANVPEASLAAQRSRRGRTPIRCRRWLAADRLDSHLRGDRTLTLPGRIGPATRESA